MFKAQVEYAPYFYLQIKASMFCTPGTGSVGCSQAWILRRAAGLQCARPAAERCETLLPPVYTA